MTSTQRLFVLLIIACSITIPGSPAEAAESATARSKRLIAVLQSQAATFDKVRACEELATIGDKTAVPALAALLDDEKLATNARSGLELIADPSAGAALREALGKLHGPLLAGAVNSVGVRGDAKAVPTLIQLANDRNSGATLEALAALGRIAAPESVEVLRKSLSSDSAETRAAAADACLVCAERLAKEGQSGMATSLYERVQQARVPRQFQTAAQQGDRSLAQGRSLFDGRSLDGWNGDTKVWRVQDGLIAGGSMKGNPHNEFLTTKASFKNFVFKCEYKLVGTEGFVNSGVQFRSVRLEHPAYEMSGYQADIGAGYSGCLYDESRRKKVLARPPAELIKRIEKPGDWNGYEIRCEGPHIVIRLNGEKTVDFTETDKAIPVAAGLIGLQMHGNNKAEVFFRNIRIVELP